MIKTRICLVGALALSAVALTAVLPAHAARPKKHPVAAAPKETPKEAVPAAQALGTFGSWAAYVSNDRTGRVCYLVGHPKKSEPAKFARKAPMAMVTHRPAEKITNVVSFVEGYPLKAGSEVALDISGRRFALFTNGDSAWARTSELDKTITGTLARGKEAVAKGVPQKGPATTDIYALAGFAQALGAIDKACDVTREESALPPPPPPPPHRVPKRKAHRH